ncbi:ATP-dependent helicase HrpB [Vibrio sp. 10N.261.46.E8]|nr:ATP-dependent helicase HrpB [Vibrio sp. 10N.261.45.E1]PMJ28302.1 ATP-dependent helicase HrpB [Vibrio sp. 10N.286.45.B6]PML88601.1 ATP-dependent helicase HrpB [Vibrio sp. 10N.261.49.E11]PMM78433.1 ATP-dependent helicase HrpB [Vibrio sp. 10N.261.46.F12]PMM91190.1 ATP-dependent helicase HrpB [Vibrio sp. 10N.261.46.E8]PMN36754.1 ATP-dependent helicase HrpB [Vibrio sp. 10N.261.45.E2]PMN45963.1 ATP-dependent helicase HrpB [Vibrio sp. 10N.261.45.E11]PMN82163.1 ATP-dependent helicase HrpB [Vibrio
MPQLPIEAVMPDLLTGIETHTQLILKAAPGAGKSTFFPLQLVKINAVQGKIIMLEPRRLAARNIATYLASQLGEKVGESIGFRVRGESKTSSATRLEIVTEGIMTRMIQTDPELTGVDMVIFDEFHERSIHADTALAFSLEIQEALRDDLKVVVMSATLDQQALQSLLPNAKYVESQGRTFPVDFRYQPLSANEYLAPKIANVIRSLMEKESGSLLAFLPGASAIKQVESQLEQLTSDIDVCPLYGQLSFSQQQKAIAPSEKGRRKVVLATNIAETSLTIEGIRLVVDSGLERVAKFDLKTGITKLEQVKISQSSAEQRAGRAGRIEEGLCVRLYSETQLMQQPAVPEPEILHSDLSSLVSELTQWGAASAEDLQWLDVPPKASIEQAKQLLQTLELLDGNGQFTVFGKQAQRLGLEPRIASMLVKAQQGSPDLLNVAIVAAALLEEPERNVTDIQHSLHRLKQRKHSKNSVVMQRAKSLASKLNHHLDLSQADESLLPLVLCFAFPDRIAQVRSATSSAFLLANGHGAEVRDDDPLANNDYIVVIDLMRSTGRASQIFLATAVDIAQIEAEFPKLFVRSDYADWDEKRGRLVAEQRVSLGKLIISTKALPDPDANQASQALLNYVSRCGLDRLNWTASAKQLVERVRCAQLWMPEHDWPAMDDASLLEHLDEWLSPYLNGIKSAKGLANVSIEQALSAYLGWPLNQEIDQWLPTHYLMPTGSKKAIRYQYQSEPVISVRMQEVFGEQDSPLIAQGRKKVVLELLSPAQRPLQITQDLAGFWAGAYKEVQKEMKGRYPKHPWPDDPATHVATTKTKRQLNR